MKDLSVTTIEGWEKRFDDRYSVAGHGELQLCEFNLRSVKSFIRDLLEKQAQEMQAQHKDDIRALREAIKNNVTDQLGARTACLDAFDTVRAEQLASREAGNK